MSRIWEAKGAHQQGLYSDGWIRVNHNRKKDPNSRYGKTDAQKDMDRTNSLKGNFSSIEKLSTSIYITNIPWTAKVKEVWDVCARWGNVVDVFISKKTSKVGSRFGFVRFTRVRDVVKLITNLRTIRMGAFHIYADVPRNPRENAKTSEPVVQFQANQTKTCQRTFAEVLKHSRKDAEQKREIYVPKQNAKAGDNVQNHINTEEDRVVKRVIDIKEDECLNIETEASSFLAKVIDVKDIPKLYLILKLNGFRDFQITYVGGRWVWVKLDAKNSFSSFKSVEMNNYFSEFKPIHNGFTLDERVIWIDIVGLPLGAWTPKAFSKVGSLWGNCLYVDIVKGKSLAHGKVCVLTRQMNEIRELIEATVFGENFDVSVYESTYWVPEFELDVKGESHGPSKSELLDGSKSEATLDHSKGAATDVTVNCDQSAVYDAQVNEQDDDHSNLTGFTEEKGKVNAMKDKVDEMNVESDILTNEREVKSTKRSKDSVDDENFVNKVADNVAKDIPTAYVATVEDDNIANYASQVEDESRLKANDTHGKSSEASVGSSSTNDKSKNIWRYRDPYGKTHGPFSLRQLHKWIDSFPMGVKIWSISGTEKESILLHGALLRSGFDIHKSRGIVKNSNDG